MKILLISHTSLSRVEGQPKSHELSRMPQMDLCLLVPSRWKQYGLWRRPETPIEPRFRFERGDVKFPWVGPVQNYLHYYPGLKKLLLSFRPDIIDVWEEPWGIVSGHACMLRNRYLPSARLVAETEQNILKKLPPPFEQCRRYVLKHTDFVIGRNSESLDHCRRLGYAGPAEVVPNAVDEKLFKPMDKQSCRARHGLAGFLVGYFGRFVEEKGLCDLLSAAAEAGPDIHLLVVGSGPFEPEIKRQAEALGIFARLTIIPSKPLQELPELMNAIDVLVLPSRTTPRWKEQFGRIIIEAQACGTPVIGSNSGGIPEVIGDAGIIVPERQPHALATAIRRLRADECECFRLGELGRQRVESKFTWSRVAERMASIYERVLAVPRRTNPRV